jgi:phosphate-selective porin
LGLPQKPIGLIAIAGATNRRPYTRFSQAGGGQLEGFEEGVAGQYRVNQAMLETAFNYKGFSWQNEWHTKTIDDTVNNTQTTMVGAYFQAGYFLGQSFDFIPKPLELAARYAYYEPNTDRADDKESETSIALNWFFKKHRNKLTMEVTNFKFEEPNGDQDNGLRFRVQWDISF